MVSTQKRLLVVFGLSCLFYISLIVQLFGTDGIKFSFEFGLRKDSSEYELRSRPYLEVVIPPNNQTWPYRVFKSSSFKPPNISVSISRPELADGYLFLTANSRNGSPGEKQDGPYIITSDNELVYARQSFTPLQFNGFRVQTLDGKRHLTFWRGQTVVGHGYGELVVLDDEYSESIVRLEEPIHPSPDIHHVSGFMDFHEQEVTQRNTVIFTAYNETRADLSPVEGSEDGNVTDSLFFEVDLHTNQILFSWSALAHFPVSSSNLPIVSDMSSGQLSVSYDSFHINSVQLVGRDYMISSRHHWAVYLVSGDDGRVVWTLSGDGRDSDFGPLPWAGQFRWQHDARAHNVTDQGMQLSLFDNHCRASEDCTTASRGILLYLKLPPDPTEVPQILHTVDPGESLFAKSQGNFQVGLSNGNQILSYGPSPVVREFGPPQEGSQLLWEGRFGHDDLAQSYRAYKSTWHATPRDWNPSLVIISRTVGEHAALGIVDVHVSWNGATDVEKWNVYTWSEGQKQQDFAGHAIKRGFETVFELELPDASCVYVAAVQAGEEVRRSNTACL